MSALDTSVINGNLPRYHAIFRKEIYKSSGIHIKLPTEYLFNLEMDDFLTKANAKHSEGWRIDLFDSFVLGDLLYCNAKWIRGDQAQYITIGQNIDEWYDENLKKFKEGFNPVLIDVYEYALGVRVSTIWEPGHMFGGTILDLPTQQLAQGLYWRDNIRIKELTVSK